MRVTKTLITMEKKTWIVTERDEKPAGKGSGHCFYCPSLIGQEHAKECVLRTRKVLVNFSIDIPIDVPESWELRK